MPVVPHVTSAPRSVEVPERIVTLYEDEHLLAVDKPAGMVVHPAYRHPDGTLYDLVSRQQAQARASRPWLLHRLDRDTSGVVLLARTERARRSVVAQFERRQVRKWYLALATRRVRDAEGIIEQPLARDPADRRRVIVTPAGQPASTAYRVVASSEHVSLLLVQPCTGRTHQIRAHLAWLGHPLLGDDMYLCGEDAGPSAPFGSAAERQMLHAWCLRVRHPIGGEAIVIRAPVPLDMRALIPAEWLAAAERALSEGAT